MRLLNDGDRYNQITFAAAKSALASRWLQEQDVPPFVVSPPAQPVNFLRQGQPMQWWQPLGQV